MNRPAWRIWWRPWLKFPIAIYLWAIFRRFYPISVSNNVPTRTIQIIILSFVVSKRARTLKVHRLEQLLVFDEDSSLSFIFINSVSYKWWPKSTRWNDFLSIAFLSDFLRVYRNNISKTISIIPVVGQSVQFKLKIAACQNIRLTQPLMVSMKWQPKLHNLPLS